MATKRKISVTTRGKMGTTRTVGTRRVGNPNPARALRLARQSNTALANERVMKLAPIVVKNFKHGIQAICDVLNKRGMKTPRGLDWTYANTLRLVSRVRDMKGIEWPDRANTQGRARSSKRQSMTSASRSRTSKTSSRRKAAL